MQHHPQLLLSRLETTNTVHLSRPGALRHPLLQPPLYQSRLEIRLNPVLRLPRPVLHSRLGHQHLHQEQQVGQHHPPQIQLLHSFHSEHRLSRHLPLLPRSPNSSLPHLLALPFLLDQRHQRVECPGLLLRRRRHRLSCLEQVRHLPERLRPPLLSALLLWVTLLVWEDQPLLEVPVPDAELPMVEGGS